MTTSAKAIAAYDKALTARDARDAARLKAKAADAIDDFDAAWSAARSAPTNQID